MRRRGLASPDDGAALALTFAYGAKRDWAEERRFDEGLQRLKRWIVRFRPVTTSLCRHPEGRHHAGRLGSATSTLRQC